MIEGFLDELGRGRFAVYIVDYGMCALFSFHFPPTYFSCTSLTPWRGTIRTNHINRKTCAVADNIPRRCATVQEPDRVAAWPRSATPTKRVDFQTPLEPSWVTQTFSPTSSEARLQFGPTKGQYTNGVLEALLFRIAPDVHPQCGAARPRGLRGGSAIAAG